LEDRCLLAGNVLQTNLVSDLPGVARFQDPQLVNPWGISESSTSAFWVSDNGTGVSTLYNTTGVKQGLVVGIPGPPAENGPGGAPLRPTDPNGSAGTPTGTVFNINPAAFVLTPPPGSTGTPGAATFLFVTEDGTIVGWKPTVLATEGVIAVDNSTNPSAAAGAVYKGMAIASNATSGPIFAVDTNSHTVLYVANFRSGQIEVYDTAFQRVTLTGNAFSDPNLPRGYAPFNVQTLGTKVYVTYAKQDADKEDDVAGPGNGFVDVFNLDGTPAGLTTADGTVGPRLLSRGALNSPWGLAIAPMSFFDRAGVLLVGNFGNGRINAFDAATGASLGALKDPDGEPIAIDGLWALQVGNGGNGGLTDHVYFTAGLDHEQHGLFGSLAAAAPGSDEGPAEAQMLQAAVDVFQLALTAVVNDINNGVPRAMLQQDLRTLRTAFVDLVHAEVIFAADTRTDSGGGGHQGTGDALQDVHDLFDNLGRFPEGRD